jgi:hypothetical protein
MYKNMTVQKFVSLTTILNLVAIVGFTIAQTYVRWKLNQNFTFLGDYGLPSLVILFAAQTFGLLFAERK